MINPLFHVTRWGIKEYSKNRKVESINTSKHLDNYTPSKKEEKQLYNQKGKMMK
jgi:hypothetical protein